MTQPRELHNCDEHCREHLDPVTNICAVCRVEHGDPCPDCGGRAFHRPGCKPPRVTVVRSSGRPSAIVGELRRLAAEEANPS